MKEAYSVHIYQSSDVKSFVTLREGEEKIGQRIQVLDSSAPNYFPESLQKSFEEGARFALLGIPEDIGPRANHGRGGAAGAWDAFLQSFLNRQSNQFLNSEQLACIGHVDLFDLMESAALLDSTREDQCEELRQLCEEIDARVAPVVKEIVLAGMQPIIIGGGHNNTYPIQRGVFEALEQRAEKGIEGLGCVNCDAHSDYRSTEGRHSGNGFRYSKEAGILKAYYALSLHEGYNSQEVLDSLCASGFRFQSYESIFIRGEKSFELSLDEAIQYLTATKLPVGVELDLDAVISMPSSAMSPVGIRNEEAVRYIYKMTSVLPSQYLYLAEGAPGLVAQDGVRTVGRSLAWYAATFIEASIGKDQLKEGK